MKKLTTAITCLAFVFASTVHGDEGIEPVAILAADPAATPLEASANTPTEVGKGSEEGANAGKSSHWGQIAIAAGAVAIAVTALVLVSKNKGKSHGHAH